MKEYLDMWKNYANFSGRTSIRGYWFAVLGNVIVSTVIGIITGILPKLAIIATLYSLAALIPGLALTVRRLRDAGKNWPWIFISFVPLVGGIILIVMLCNHSVPVEPSEEVYIEA
jgi:uncharacterized membrane protein YhaH (DUF805 family)